MSDKPSIAVILSGCGHKDGSEIHEATLTLLAIHRLGAEYQCYAPNINQHHVLNFITDQELSETRNVLVESARIARGNIQDLSTYDQTRHDALVLPGGFGAAKNLSDFAFKGKDCTINPDVEKAILTTHKAGKPIGALCISPVILAKLLPGVQVTIGQDGATSQSIHDMGGTHCNTNHGEVVVDTKRKIVTTPCYMLDARVDQIADGAENLIKVILEMK